MANRNNQLKAYVRYDGTGRVIAGSLILQRFKPKVGNWVEIEANECCNFTTTTTTTTVAPTSTTTTTTVAPTTTTTTSTVAPTTTSTTTVAPTTTTTTTTSELNCFCYTVDNQTAGLLDYTYTNCGSEVPTSTSIEADTISIVCSSTAVTGDDGLIITGGTLSCNNSEGCPVEPTTTTTTTEAPTTTTTTTAL
jgi:hypothetical protein